MADYGEIHVGRDLVARGATAERGWLAHNLFLVRKHPARHVMILLVLVWIVIFHYIPIYGITIAFRRFNIASGFFGGDFVGFRYFVQFFTDPSAPRLIRNTLLIGFWNLLFTFPAPIIFALLLNEVHHTAFKRSMQTLSYLPYFVSTVVIVGLTLQLVNYDGLITIWIGRITGERPIISTSPEWFRPLYIATSLWQGVGWGSIIYLATITGINPELYEAAEVDGAGRFARVRHITLPSLLPMIMILLILNTREIVTVGAEKALLLQNPATYETSDVIATYVYRRGIEMAQHGYATAVSVINQLAAFAMVLATNMIVKRVRGEGLW